LTSRIIFLLSQKPPPLPIYLRFFDKSNNTILPAGWTTKDAGCVGKNHNVPQELLHVCKYNIVQLLYNSRMIFYRLSSRLLHFLCGVTALRLHLYLPKCITPVFPWDSRRRKDCLALIYVVPRRGWCY
jgi:hypothetical protein